VIRRDYLYLILRGIDNQCVTCARFNLWCIDPPALTSGMIKRFAGLSDHAIETFWKFVDSTLRPKLPIKIFKIDDVIFLLAMEHMKTHIRYSRKYNVYLDDIDCFINEDLECIEVPISHVMKVYLVGSYGEEVKIKLNVVFILKTLYKYSPRLYNNLMNSIKSLIYNGTSSISDLISCIIKILMRYRGILRELVGPLPLNKKAILNSSPVLRKLLYSSTIQVR